MGKWTDKNYITHSEWERDFGGAKKKLLPDFKRLPFHCCALTLRPFETPVCTTDGVVFDSAQIIPYLKKYGTNPVTGKLLAFKDLIPLHFHKNTDGEYHDPVTFKVFNDNTKIVAIRTSGNVYSYDSIESLNIKMKNWEDLMTSQPFTRQDIIVLQDPMNLDETRNFATYYHVVNNLNIDEEELEKMKDPSYYINTTEMADRILSKIGTSSTSGSGSGNSSPTPGPNTNTATTTTITSTATAKSNVNLSKPRNAAHFSDGSVMASFTSSAVNVATKHVSALWNEDDLMYEEMKQKKQKGYARLVTNFGDINLELHADMAPMTVHNFILLAKSGYYKDTIFHRSIKDFMLQGGDPTGTGRGGDSYWKGTFKDEFHPKLHHEGRGVLSMANRGPNTNGSQFFITYKSCLHLDNKHTIFGRVVGGLENLIKMEKVETDGKDSPKQPIILKDVIIFSDPFENLEKEKKEAAEKEKEAAAKKEAMSVRGQWYSQPTSTSRPTAFGSGVGKYIKRDRTEDRKSVV